MATKSVSLNVLNSARSTIGQGVIAFLVGGIVYIIGQNILPYLTEGFAYVIFAHHVQGQWGLAISLFVMAISSMLSAALGALVVIQVMRWLGTKTKRKAAIRFLLLSCVVYVAVSFVFFAMGTNNWQNEFIQTLEVYAQILGLGLPFTLVWLWATKQGGKES